MTPIDQPEPTAEPSEGHAHGANSLIDVLRAASERGYATPLRLDGRGRLLCGACENSSAAASVEVDRYQRLEGASDAADLMLVALVECPHCGARGSMTLGYGPNSSDADASFLAELDLREASPEPITGATGS